MNQPDAARLAEIILDWLKHRNGGELFEPFDNMRVGDARFMHEELELILKHEGRPPNWQPIKPVSPSK